MSKNQMKHFKSSAAEVWGKAQMCFESQLVKC